MAEAAGADVELIQFLYSPYNEKVRWALDWKRVPHRRRSLLPGPHLPYLKKRSGQTQTPVLRIDGEYVAGSATILDTIEQRWPEPALLPAAGGERRLILDIQRRFDEDWGPRMRRALLAPIIDDSAYFAAVFGADHPGYVQNLYRWTVPFARPLIRKANGIADRASIDDGIVAADEAFSFVARRAQDGGGYLISRRFTLADLVACAHLAIFAEPRHPDTLRPRPTPAALEYQVARWQAHAGSVWVREIYRRHRPTPIAD
ncbi:MAG TPA: glutathione S-transferase family protein [Solimonas sp.]